VSPYSYRGLHLLEEIRSPLFERSQKTPVLTDAGELLYDYAKRILSLRDQTFNVVAELKSLQRGRVRIGANESTSLYLLPHLILDYRALHPDVMVEIFRQSSDRLPREVLDRNVDFALMAFEPVDDDLESFPVLRDELVLITHPQHPLAKLPDVQPAVRRALQAPVVQVEPVYVDIGASHKKQRLPFGSLAPYPRRDRGDRSLRSIGSVPSLICAVKRVRASRERGTLGPTA